MIFCRLVGFGIVLVDKFLTKGTLLTPGTTLETFFIGLLSLIVIVPYIKGVGMISKDVILVRINFWRIK